MGKDFWFYSLGLEIISRSYLWDTQSTETLCLVVVPLQETKKNHFWLCSRLKIYYRAQVYHSFGKKTPVTVAREIKYVLNHPGSLAEFHWFLIKQNRQINTTNSVLPISGLCMKSMLLYYTGVKRPLSRENSYFMKDLLCLCYSQCISQFLPFKSRAFCRHRRVVIVFFFLIIALPVASNITSIVNTLNGSILLALIKST